MSEIAERAYRKKRRPPVIVVTAGSVVGLVGMFAVSRGSPDFGDAIWPAGATLAALWIAARVRRDRCSLCKADLPLRVLDDTCPGCHAPIAGIEDDDGRRTDLPGAIRRDPQDASPSGTPYRAGGTAARDAAEAAQLMAMRTDMEGHRKRLLADPKIARALADRDDLALHRLLAARRRKAQSIAEESAIDAVLSDPRRALVPVKRRPWLGVLGSSGFVLAAPRLPDPDDGSFVADQHLVLGSYSIVPIASLVARRREGGIDVLGRVPLPFFKRVWRSAFALPLVALAAFGAHTYVESRSSKVYLVNGLDVAVTISVAGERVQVGPLARDFRVLPKGRHTLVTTDDRGRKLETIDVDVPGGSAFVAYDVLGVTPIVASEVFYGGYGETPGDLRREEHIGDRVIIKDNVAFPFVAAPRELKRSGTWRTWQIERAPGGWRGAVDTLRAQGHAAAVDLVKTVCLAEPENDDAVWAASETIAAREGVAAALVFLREVPPSEAVRAARERLQAGAR